MIKDYELRAVFVPKFMRNTTSPCDLCDSIIGKNDTWKVNEDYYEDCAEMEGLDLFSVDCDDFTDYDRRENDVYLAYVTNLL